MAFVVTAPRTLDDAETTELCALENHFQIISESDPDLFYYSEGDDISDESVEDEEMPSELLKLLVKVYQHNL